ncbi:hypothetical protein [Variovorax sp. HJSM1_2]|uniref:hypothetical protein n=1 Tax=Variovorax sp. HJSM1_2 TaxID=3366263 RepID=UPI003BC19BBC
MLSNQIRNSGSLIDSVDAIRNWRAVLLLLVTLACTAVIMAFGGVMANLSLVFTGLFALLAYVVLFYGVNAVGMMMMDEARGEHARTALSAVLASVAVSHRLILVFLLLAGLYMAGFVALAIILLLCKIPLLGPLLYTLVFPVSVVIVGIALCAVPTVVFPLAAPAVWGGANTMQTVSQLLAVGRRRLPMVLLLMIAVMLISSVVGLVIGTILYAGTAATAVLSAPILGIGGIFGDASGVVSAAEDARLNGYAIATSVGGGLLVAVAFTLPGMVYLRGASDVYLRAIDGLDLESEQAEMDDKIASARAAAQALQAQAQAAVQKYAPKPAANTKAPGAAAPGAVEPHFDAHTSDVAPAAASGHTPTPAARAEAAPPSLQPTLFDADGTPLTTPPAASPAAPAEGPAGLPPKQ